jgi:hypothetical protein
VASVHWNVPVPPAPGVEQTQPDVAPPSSNVVFVGTTSVRTTFVATLAPFETEKWYVMTSPGWAGFPELRVRTTERSVLTTAPRRSGAGSAAAARRNRTRTRKR